MLNWKFFLPGHERLDNCLDLLGGGEGEDLGVLDDDSAPRLALVHQLGAQPLLTLGKNSAKHEQTFS